MDLLAFQASAEAQARVDFLLAKSKSDELNTLESKEMESYMMVDQLVQLTKAKALLF